MKKEKYCPKQSSWYFVHHSNLDQLEIVLLIKFKFFLKIFLLSKRLLKVFWHDSFLIADVLPKVDEEVENINSKYQCDIKKLKVIMECFL